MLSLCKTWIVVLKFSIHFWGTSSISIPQLWRDSLLLMDLSTAFIHNNKYTEVTSCQQVLYRCFQCASLESMCWNSVSTYGAHLHFLYHSCEEIVYFSRDFSPTFIQFIHHTEVTANQLKSFRCFHCARLESMYWNTVSTFGVLLQFQYHSCEEIVYFLMVISCAFIHNIQCTEVTSGQQVL